MTSRRGPTFGPFWAGLFNEQGEIASIPRVQVTLSLAVIAAGRFEFENAETLDFGTYTGHRQQTVVGVGLFAFPEDTAPLMLCALTALAPIRHGDRLVFARGNLGYMTDFDAYAPLREGKL
jgi:hypothetical protein